MFSLIITIVSIALVTALALATIYYGGQAFRQGGAEAAAARIVNEGQQIRGALTLYESTTGEKASSMEALVSTNALKSAPEGWGVIDGYTYRPESDMDVCLAANKKAGLNLTEVPSCSDAAYANDSVCCKVTT